MSYEVEILAVGDESQSGDAIAIRIGNFLQDPTDQRVVVIDGGFRDSGEKMVERIKTFFGTDVIDLMISTHPDSDHVNGLHILMDQMTVRELWIHRPWQRSEQIKKMAEDRSVLAMLSASGLKKSLTAAYDLEKAATAKGVVVREPFQGI